MAETSATHVHRKMLRARLRLIVLLVTGIGILVILHAFAGGLDWYAWVVGIVALLLSAVGWVVWGTREGGWLRSCVVTWGAHLVCAAALFMWGEFGVASLVGGLVYGTVWAGVLLLPIAIVSTVLRSPAEPGRPDHPQ